MWTWLWTTAVHDEYQASEFDFPPSKDSALRRWRRQLSALSSDATSVRDATANAQDGRRVKDLQFACSPLSVRSVRDNVAMIAGQPVLMAEIQDVHVGFCIALSGSKESDPLFIQVVGVAPEVQRRGVGLTLIAAAAAREPQRDIALATQDDNWAARALNQRFANSINSTIERVPRGTFRASDLGIVRGSGYRAWLIRRPTSDQGERR